MQFIITHLSPLPCLPHLLLNLLLTLVIIQPMVIATIADIHPTVVATSVVVPPHCNIVLVIKLLIVKCK
jgi:hypothetical protein